MGLLPTVLVLPAVGALVIALLPPRRETIRLVALVTTLATFAVSLAILAVFDPAEAGFQLVVDQPWISAFDVRFKLGIDGISLWLVVLNAFLNPLVVLASWNHTRSPKGYFASFLVLETAVMGVFLALDLALFYVFWDIVLVPMYVIIGIWGYDRRRYASVKFFLYTFLGGLLMLVGILALYAQTFDAFGSGTFDYEQLLGLALDPTLQGWLFVLFSVSFLVKIPLWPVHTWLPDAHTEAPTGGSVILAGVLLKLGGYGLLRYSVPLFPEAARAAVPWLLALSVIGIIYGALVALMQRDLKKLVAYSSVSHMGFVVLGIFALNEIGTTGGVLQMVNHGLSTGALFLLVGFLYERRHTRQIAAFGGLAKRTPIYAAIFLVVALSSLALPGLNGFTGEFPILLGAFQTSRWAGSAAAIGMILAALYLLWAYQRVFHGPLRGADNEHTSDLNALEIGVLAPLVALIVLIGVWPQPFLDRIEPAVARIVQRVEAGGVGAASTAPTDAVPAPASAPTSP